MKEKGRLQYLGAGWANSYYESADWANSCYESDLGGFIRDWLRGYIRLRYRWVENGKVVYLPEYK